MRDLLDEAARAGAGRALVDVRVPLERGRMLRSSGDPTAAYPFFVTAFERAAAAGEYYLAADAAHMAALAAPDDVGFRAWTTRGIELGEREQAAAYWRGPLLNNLGWALHERGEHDEALSVFEQALAVREEDQSDEHAIEIARYAIAVALRALGRPAEAAAQAERAVDGPSARAATLRTSMKSWPRTTPPSGGRMRPRSMRAGRSSSSART